MADAYIVDAVRTAGGKRGGKLTFSENITEYYDESGELVVRATGVGVRTEKVVESD